ncbi:MAG: 30S ribosomal protein S17 [Candidatus Sericytochromatia bacterium]
MSRRIITGKVVSDKMDKTLVVAVESTVSHPRYKKMVKQTTKFKAHDEDNTAKEGDIVKIEESRPLSRDKRWRLVEVVERGQ